MQDPEIKPETININIKNILRPDTIIILIILITLLIIITLNAGDYTDGINDCNTHWLQQTNQTPGIIIPYQPTEEPNDILPK